MLNALLKLNTHPSIEEIYAEINKDHPSISKTTVYRNLRLLSDSGIIARVLLPDGLERYDKSAICHYHFSCTVCGHIYDVDIERLERIDSEVQEKYGFCVDRHDVVFSGTCLECQSNKELPASEIP